MHQKKAISPIIAIIILLLITIAIAGAGYSYISTYWTGMTSKQIEVINAFCVQTGHQGKILVKNIGTSPLNTNEISVINTRTGEDLSQDVLWSSEIADSGLVLQLRFDEGSGTKATDTSGQGNDGTLINGTGQPCFTNGACPDWDNGKIVGALSFDGDGDYVEIGDKDVFDGMSELTIIAWVKPNMHDNWDKVVSKRDVYYFDMGSAGFRCYLYNSTGDGKTTGQTQISDNVWTHLACTYDGSVITTYVNGTLENTANLGGATADNSNAVGIGRHETGTHYFNGIIDEVRIYNRALEPDEIKALAENSVTIEPGDSATLTHTCDGRCSYNLILGTSSAEAIINC